MLQKETDHHTNHQVEPSSLEARLLGNTVTRTLCDLVRNMPAEARERLEIPDTMDMRIRSFYQAWFDEKIRHPRFESSFYEKRLSERLNRPLEEIQEELRVARILSAWFHAQFFGVD